jgi:hypothetical protein
MQECTEAGVTGTVCVMHEQTIACGTALFACNALYQDKIMIMVHPTTQLLGEVRHVRGVLLGLLQCVVGIPAAVPCQ